jgi:hypothetical protein
LDRRVEGREDRAHAKAGLKVGAKSHNVYKARAAEQMAVAARAGHDVMLDNPADFVRALE